MAQPNIFKISSYSHGPEDRFTAALHYLLHCYPSIGQEIVDAIADQAGISRSPFLRSTDHPQGDEENKPDFMLSCQDYDILCEHKLESDLGKDQLERYLRLPQERPTYVALITNRNHQVSEDVLVDANYLRPRASAMPYFFWESIFPIVANKSERLVSEFADYMRSLSMAPCALSGGWDRLFSDKQTAEAFYDCTREMRAYFKENGGSCKSGSSRLGFEVHFRSMHPWIGLLYIYVSKAPSPPELGIEGCSLSALLYVQESEADRILKFQNRHDQISTASGTIIGRTMDRSAPWKSELKFIYRCVATLDKYLDSEPAVTRSRLRNFGQAVAEQIIAIGE